MQLLLGANKGVHSMLVIYYTLLDLPPSMQSKIDTWFIASVSRAKQVKDHHDEVFRPLVEGAYFYLYNLKMSLLNHFGSAF